MIRLAFLAAACAASMGGCVRRVAGNVVPPPGDPPPGDDGMGRMLVWVVALCIAGIGACIAALVWLPLAKKTAVAGAFAFAAMAVTAMGLRAVIPWMPYIMGGVFFLGAIAAIYLIRRRLNGAPSIVNSLGAIRP